MFVVFLWDSENKCVICMLVVFDSIVLIYFIVYSSIHDLLSIEFMNQYLLPVLFLGFMSISALSQTTKDTTTLQSVLRNGKVSGHIRNFLMATDNAAGLNDAYANGFGVGIGYESAPYHNFQVGISGFFMVNIFSSDLSLIDSATFAPNRYEIGLFDVQNARNTVLNRLENFYLKYSLDKFTLKIGKQLIKTPFINPQDGRLAPTMVEAALFEWKNAVTKVEGGWINKISPRGTLTWFPVANSIGIYPRGFAPNGSRSGYVGNLSSAGVFYTGITHDITPHYTFQAWDFYVENIFNSVLFQFNSEKPSGANGAKITTGLQFIMQNAINNGGNSEPQKAYLPQGNTAYTISGNIGYSFSTPWKVELNYTHITSDGRYLMPREWGRDPFFTFTPREKNDGFGGVDAINGAISHDFGNGFNAEIKYGHFYMPDVKNTVLNKYALPSYNHCNINLQYEFSGFLRGLNMQILFVYKGLLGNSYGDDFNLYNKVTMAHYEFVTNYHF